MTTSSKPQCRTYTMGLFCRIFGHDWQRSVIDIVVPSPPKGNAVYKARRCRRCKALYPRTVEHIGWLNESPRSVANDE